MLAPAGHGGRGRLPGELLSVATSDAKRAAQIAHVVAMGAGVLAALVVATVVLLRISLPLGLLVVLGLPPVLLAVQLAGRPLTRRSSAEQVRAAAAAGVATDLVRGLRVLKGIGGERAAVDRYRAASGASLRATLRATLRAARAEAAYDAATIVLTGGFLVLVVLVAGRLAASGDVTIGQLVAALGLTQFLIGPLQRVSYLGAELSRARASAARVAAVLASPAAAGTRRALPSPVRGELRLRDVTHGVMRDVSAVLPAGAFTGIVATDPRAADALLECLRGEPGAVELDGVALHDLDPGLLREAVLVSPHEAELFELTLAEKVREAAHGEVAHALAAAGADDVAAALPDGADTLLAERGSSLSCGQRQRVALARALAADPPVLVLHDPTTAVDAATEARIAGGLRALRRGRSTLVLTSSPALLAASDRVLLLDAGTIADSGTHDELLRRSPAYRAAVLG